VARHDKYYNQQEASCSIFGTPLQDFSDGESIRALYTGDHSSVTVGTDGATQNLSNDRTGRFEIDLKETSVSNGFLANLLATQQAGNFLDISGAVLDGSGTTHGGTGGTIKTAGNVSTGGPAMGKRTWVIEFTVMTTDR
jgi:hypothetical protein